jgi:hypothetical protein
MADTIDWTDETLRPLDALARLAFPDGGVTAETLRRRARQGKLTVYRPGKAYLATLSGVRAMIEKTRIARELSTTRVTPVVPNSLGLTEMDLSNMALDELLEGSGRPAKEARKAKRRGRRKQPG